MNNQFIIDNLIIVFTIAASETKWGQIAYINLYQPFFPTNLPQGADDNAAGQTDQAGAENSEDDAAAGEEGAETADGAETNSNDTTGAGAEGEAAEGDSKGNYFKFPCLSFNILCYAFISL